MQKLLPFLFFIFSNQALIGQDVSLFDKEGNPIAFISPDDGSTIYLWSGKPEAYLFNDGSKLHVYSFSGKHLGWFENGVIRDHSGNVSAFTKNSIVNVMPKLEGMKGLKSMKPLKGSRELAPSQPLNTLTFSNTPFNITLSSANNNTANTFSHSSSATSTEVEDELFKPNTKLTPVKPYMTDVQGTLGLLNAKIEEYQKMRAAGYVLDPQTNMWVTPEFIANRKKMIKQCITDTRARFDTIAKSLPPLKEGTYKAQFIEINGNACFEVDVTLRKDLTIKRISFSKEWKYPKDMKVFNRIAFISTYRRVEINSQVGRETGAGDLLFLN